MARRDPVSWSSSSAAGHHSKQTALPDFSSRVAFVGPSPWHDRRCCTAATRFGSTLSNAPALIRLSMTRLLTVRRPGARRDVADVLIVGRRDAPREPASSPPERNRPTFHTTPARSHDPGRAEPGGARRRTRRTLHPLLGGAMRRAVVVLVRRGGRRLAGCGLPRAGLGLVRSGDIAPDRSPPGWRAARPRDEASWRRHRWTVARDRSAGASALAELIARGV